MRIPWWRRKPKTPTGPTEVDYALERAKADLAFTRAQTPIFEAIADPDTEPLAVRPTERGSRNGG